MSEKQELIQVRRPRRSAAVIEQLVAEYAASGLQQVEFCRRRGMALSTLNRHLKKQQDRQNQAGSNGVEQSRLVAVELAAAVATVSAGVAGVLTVLLSNRRRVEVGRGFDAATLTQLITVLERL